MSRAPEEVIELAKKRSGRDLVKMARRIERSGGCERPVRLRATGPGSPSQDEPDGVLLVSCKTRRESRCKPCSSLYRGDAHHLVRSGMEGGKGVPESVKEHPAVFLTLTLGGFGAVHRASPGPCHAVRPGRCAHGRATYCLERHAEGDDVVGTPICPGCYDYRRAVVANSAVTELWRRLSVYARRHLAYEMGTTEKELKGKVRLYYGKAAELQRRGAVHLHAVVRADGATDELSPPGLPVTAAVLAAALGAAARAVSCKRVVDGVIYELSFGDQLRAEPLEPQRARAYASYISKYVLKDSSGSGALDHRLKEGELETLDLPAHLAKIVATAFELGADPEQRRFRRWAHALGFAGHVITHSRSWSTTFTRLRAERLAWRRAAEQEMEETSPALTWRYEGTGYRLEIDRLLAATFAEERRLAKEEVRLELRTTGALA